MRKKYLSALLFGVLLVTSTGTFTSCKDYDDEINSLTERVESIEKTVNDMKTSIENGSVITDVKTTNTGVTVTLSDGKTFELTNGSDGKPGSVVSIGDNGNWFIDGVDTGKPSRGEKGEDGQDGQDGQDGTSNIGIWYEPGEDGYWYVCKPGVDGEIIKEKWEDHKWVSSSVTVVYDTNNGRLMISNIEGVPEGSVLIVETWGELKSLAVIPYVVDENLTPIAGFYNIVKNGNVLSSTNATVHYRLNPNNANTDGLEWSIIDRKVTTRANGDNVNSLLEIKDLTRADGELVVTLKSKKSIADLQKYESAIFALNATNTANGNNILSDYTKVEAADLTNFAIVNPNEVPEFIFESPYPSVITNIKDVNAEMVYDKNIDLNTLVETWAKDLNNHTTLEGLGVEGLTYKFSKPQTYLGEDNETNQQTFVELNEETGIVTVSEGFGTSAVGRTPIFLAHALVNGVEVATGYIKIEIVKTETPSKPLPAHQINATEVELDYEELVAGKDESKFTWEEMNKEVYAQLGLTRETFKEYYDIKPEINYNGIEGVAIKTDNDFTGQTGTNVATLSFDPTLIPSTINNKVVVTYKAKDPYKHKDVEITFPYQISHKHVSPLKFNEYFVVNDIAVLRGRVVNGKWENSSEISEHFKEGLNPYQVSNHNMPYLELVNPIEDADIKIDNNDLTDQVIRLTQPISTESRDVKVRVVEPLVNGEKICTFEYTIRFINPFKVELKPVTLLTPLGGKPDNESIADGEIIIKQNVENGKVLYDGTKFTEDAAIYSMDGNTQFNYEVTVNNKNWAQYGLNNDNIQKLSIDNKGLIVWDNAGTSLEKQIDTTYKVTVVVDGIASVSANGNLTVKRTADSNN